MKRKLKQFTIAFIFMVIFHLLNDPLDLLWDFGIFTPHVGTLYVVGLLFGPYGAFGAVVSNAIFDLLEGYTPIEVLASAIISFGVSCLAYKLWYSGFKSDELTKPKLDNIYHMGLFVAGIFICGAIYSITHGTLIQMIFGHEMGEFLTLEYFMNFTNIAFIFGIIIIWISKRIDFVEIPKISKRHANKKLYRALFICLILVLISTRISMSLELGTPILIGEIALIAILLYAYLTKPIESEVKQKDEITILERIMDVFLLTTLVIALFGILLSFEGYSNAVIDVKYLENYLPSMPLLALTDILILLFFIPGFAVMRYVETRVTKPIVSFSRIENFIKENEKIEGEGLLEVYSEYIDDEDEIGKLARSYTNLIQHNNNYIENIYKIEGEKKRIEAELDIARRIQAANLPTEAIETEEYFVNGYSHPAKEVGGDFFDYYQLDDENLAIVIGDASGKGIPAAILAMNTQVLIKQILKYELNPSKVLSLLNNQLCENNSETMFVTLWLGIYNKNHKKIIFSNAGHNPPLVKENGEFKYLDIESGIVLGVMEDFEYVNEELDLSQEIVLYTDGITDANNIDNEMYGEDRLLEFFNNFKKYENPIKPLLDEIDEFSQGTEQFDDMTILYLKDKQ